MKNNISIKEIAKLCNVSTATVSKVLNNKGRFSEETRQKVLEVVKKYNYQTNMVAKSLRTNKSQIIGVIVPDIINEFFACIIKSIESYFFPHGYSVFICNTDEDVDKEKEYLRQFEAKGVDGIIYISGKSGNITNTIKRDIPIVCIDRKPSGKSDIVTIESDNRMGGYLATEELIRKGCRNIAVLKDYRDLSTTKHRFKGYQDALLRYNINFNAKLIKNIKVDFNSARIAVLELIDSGINFDGIFAFTDWLALGALTALKERKIKVPDQIKIVGFDNISTSQYSYPSITTINQDKEMIGQTAANILLNLINKEYNKVSNIVIPVSLVVRETT
ncbi:LacI family transcriptional regulator [Caloramator sp. E03]|uniref:LacI family DNA-binding transcriptional regulator n=1 Tax=Caloramator sp. E03 TaxID=2576307 RepID=UPI00111039EA|nr:LacI family DNA-binding transcriptional regulator [Caloramator sp. E03]QCX34024.1 LacI family transcriptional regulator [Caloramator sp. E03]